MNNLEKSKKNVFVALSGGVDSAVSAALLKDQGYNVTGVYMKNWSGDDFGIQADCPWEIDQADAKAVCDQLGIPFRSFNFEKEYREKVVEYFFSEYQAGRTPNPDVMCNKEIKFKLFLDKALEEGADLIATGHYARVKPSEEDNSPFNLFTGVDNNKNQVYFLYNITQDQLSKTLFPIGKYTKDQVRELAKKFKLPNAQKPDSQGICFIGEINVLQFLMSKIPKKEGKIIDIDTGEEMGQHDGIFFYTIGQRAKIANQEVRYFFCKKDIKTNTMYVCKGRNHPALFKKQLTFKNPNWIEGKEPSKKVLSATIRYRQEPQEGELTKLSENEYQFTFKNPEWAVAEGQSIVLFDNEKCLGGGVIEFPL